MRCTISPSPVSPIVFRLARSLSSPSPVSPIVFRRARSLSSPLTHHHPSSSPFNPCLLHRSSSSPFNSFLLHHSSSSSPFSFTPKALPSILTPYVSGFSSSGFSSVSRGILIYLFVSTVSLVKFSSMFDDWLDPFLIYGYPIWLFSVIKEFAPAANLPYVESVQATTIACVFWFFLHGKSIWFSSKLASLHSSSSKQKEILLRRETVTTLLLIVLGFVMILQVLGVTGESFVTFSGVGAVATAFASKDILANILSGISLHFSQHFVPGETIKVGSSYEGEVLKIGITTTSLLDSVTKREIYISNSEIASQTIVNQSRAQWRGRFSFTIPLDLNKVPPVKISLISMEVIKALKGNGLICLREEIPSCFLDYEEKNESLVGLKITCNIVHMISKEDYDFARQQIRLDILKILKKHGI